MYSTHVSLDEAAEHDHGRGADALLAIRATLGGVCIDLGTKLGMREGEPRAHNVGR